MKAANSLLFYVATAYLISWLFFILLALNHHQIIFLFQDEAAHAHLQDIWHAFGGLGPLIAAIATLNIYHGREIRNQFREGYSVRKLDIKGWVLALSPLLILATALVTSRLIQGEWRSILSVSLWHLTFNLVSMITKDEAVVSAIMSSVIMFLAAFVLVRYKFRNLSPLPKTGLQTATQSQYLKDNGWIATRHNFSQKSKKDRVL